MSNLQQSQQRSEYIAGMRALLDFLEANPEIPLPYDGSDSSLDVFVYDKAAMAKLTRFLGKGEKEAASDKFLSVTGKVRGLKLRIYGRRDLVCTRRLVGTREVTKTIPDPSVEVPLVEVTETKEIFEYDCGSILAPAEKVVE